MTAAPSLAVLTASTVAIEDPGPLLALLPEHDALAWVSDHQGLVGWGVAARHDLRGPDRFVAADLWWAGLVAGMRVQDDVGLPGTGPLAFGSFSFDGGSSVLVVPRVVVGHRDGRWWLTSVTEQRDDPLPDLGAPRDPARPPGAVLFTDGGLTPVEWVGVVAGVVGRINAGEVSKVVLARDVRAHTTGPLDVRWPLQRLAAGYPGCWTFAVDGLLGATPEMLLRLSEGVATSRVLAGTLRRSGDANRDQRKGAALAGSIKDLEEHGYGVRSVTDALARHCRAVQAPEEPFVLALPNVMHLATDVSGVVADGSTSLGLVAALHPTAAVCGTPADVALGVIRDVEGLDRGRYAGPVGWMDAAGDGEWGIALRCAEVDPHDPAQLRLFAGCGLVAGSRPDEELAESVAKLVPMREALQS